MSVKILVTGASGFIGHHVVHAVRAAGHEPVSLVRRGSDLSGLKGIQHRVADLRDESALGAAVAGVDTVIHLAGLTRAKNLAAFLEVNSAGVERLVKACREAVPQPSRFVLVSSIAAAGPGTPDRPRREVDGDEPKTPYGKSKLAGECALRETAGSLPWTIVRPPIVYGPRERDVMQIFRMCRRGVVPVVGFRDKHYSVVYGPDLAQHLVELAEAPAAAGGTYFVAEPKAYTYAELVQHIGVAVGRVPWRPRLPHLVPGLIALGGTLIQPFCRRPPLVTLAKLPEILAPGWVCSVEAAQALLGEVAPTSLPEGAVRTAAWYREAGWI